MADSDLKTHVWYHLPETIVTITGTVTTKTRVEDGEVETSGTPRVSLAPRADPARYYGFDFEVSKLSESELKLEFTEDGRILNTEATSTGKLGTIFKNIFGLVTTIIGAIGGAPLGGGTGPSPSGAVPDPVQAKYEQDHPTLGRRRTALRDAIDVLASKLIALQTSISEAADETARKLLVGHAEAVVKGLEALRTEAREVEAHFSAWKARKESPRELAYEFRYPIASLPDSQAIEKITGKPTENDLGEIFPSFEAFHVVLSRRDLPIPGQGPRVPDLGTSHRGVIFRHPRLVELSLWVFEDKKLVRAGQKTEGVVDAQSPIGFLEFGKTNWSQRNASLAMHPSGALHKLSNRRESELAAASEALKDIPETMRASLEKANQIIDQQQALSLQGVEQRISELTKQKELLQAEIAYSGTLATADQTRELARIKSAIDLLTARKELGSLAGDADLQSGIEGMNLRTALMTLQVELEKARTERLKVEAQLKAVKGDGR